MNQTVQLSLKNLTVNPRFRNHLTVKKKMFNNYLFIHNYKLVLTERLIKV